MAPFAPLRRELGAALDRGAVDARDALTTAAHARGVRSGGDAPIRFVDGDDAGAAPYEAHIAATGRVPTRANLHDLFNAFVWLVFPRTKAALNARQAAEIAQGGVGPRRGAVRDAATLVDESGLLLAARDTRAFDLLARRQWRALLVDDRARWGRDIVPLAFGHALLEKLVAPYKAITAAVVCLPFPGAVPAADDIVAFDAAAAAFVRDASLAPRALQPLPVLGIPGWWRANEEPAFYDDAAVFRTGERARRARAA